MKIVVIGGTGLIGSKLVERLRRAGHEPLAASPHAGVETDTRKGREPARAGGEDAVVEEQVDPGAGDEGGELFEEFDGLEEEVRGAIAPHGLEVHEHAAVGAQAQPVLGERERRR